MTKSKRVSSLGRMGEIDLIDILHRQLETRSNIVKLGIGDDACVLNDGTVISVDSFVEGIHFQLEYFDHYTLGRRLMAAALSDLAAMAAEPAVSLVSIMLRPETKLNAIKGFYRGMNELCQSFNCPIVGGDTDTSSVFAVSIVVVGKTKNPTLRSAGQPGDGLYITGYPGLSEAGRLAIKNRFSRARFKEAISRHLTPMPRIREALKMRKRIRAMIDTSDGLSTDAFHLSVESKVRIVIDWEKVPVHQEVQELARILRLDLKEFILSSGEDFELLFTSPRILPNKIGALKITAIGYVTKGRGLFMKVGKRIRKIEPSGYEHFKNS